MDYRSTCSCELVAIRSTGLAEEIGSLWQEKLGCAGTKWFMVVVMDVDITSYLEAEVVMQMWSHRDSFGSNNCSSTMESSRLSQSIGYSAIMESS